MKTSESGNLGARLAALALASVVALNVGWTTVLAAEAPLTEAQEAGIREEMGGLAQVLVGGGMSPQEAKLAVNAVGRCLGAAYSNGLTRQQADRVCGLVLDAFIIQPGATQYTLTPDDQAWIATRTVLWTSELSATLDPDELGAVQSTMQACLGGFMRRGETRGDAVGKCALGLLPLLNQPELRDRLLEAAATP